MNPIVFLTDSEARITARLRRKTIGEYSLIPFDQSRSIFVHIPKAAGVSVCRALYNSLGGGHCSISTYKKVFSAEEFSSYYKFTITRNPWDRLYSAFSFLQSGGFCEQDRSFFEQNLKKYKSFESFVMDWLSLRTANSYIHFFPQMYFLKTIHNPTLEFDFIGRFENLEKDFSIISKRVKNNAKLEITNVTNRKVKSYINIYTQEMIEKVAEIYREDIKLLNYQFDNS